jgi:hypothetical protein
MAKRMSISCEWIIIGQLRECLHQARRKRGLGRAWYKTGKSRRSFRRPVKTMMMMMMVE